VCVFANTDKVHVVSNEQIRESQVRLIGPL
jgi:hypothetical protein